MQLLTKDEIKNSCPMKKMNNKAMVKHQWYIANRRGGDSTPKTRGRPFFSKTLISDKADANNGCFTKTNVPSIVQPLLAKQPLLEDFEIISKDPKPKPIKKKMTGVEKRRRIIALNLEKVNKRAEAFRELLKASVVKG